MRRLVIALLVLVAVLVGVDYGAAALAESAVSKQMRQQLGLADDPSVRINGFPFLTQALAGSYSSVDVTATRLSAGQLRELEVRAQLRGVDAPLSTVLGSGPKTLHVRQVEGMVRVNANDLERLLPVVSKLHIDSLDAKALQQAVKDGGDASLAEVDPAKAARLSGTVTQLGQPVSVIVVLELNGGKVRLVPRDIRVGEGKGSKLAAADERRLRDMFTVNLDPGSLPLNIKPTALTARDGTLQISGIADDVKLPPGSN